MHEYYSYSYSLILRKRILFVFVFGQNSDSEYYSYSYSVQKTVFAHLWLVVGVWLLFGAHWLGGATYLGVEVHLCTPVVVQLYLAVRGSLVWAPGCSIFNCTLLCALCSVVGAGGNSLFLNRPAIVDPFHLVSNHHASYRNQLNTHNVELKW